MVQNLVQSRPKRSARAGPKDGPKQEPTSKEDTASIPIPGTPFRLTAEGRLHVAVDLQELLTNQGIPGQLAQRLIAQKDPEAVAKVLLNALYLQSEGKLQNGPGYIRAGIEDGYDLLPQVASRLENRRREMEAQLRKIEAQQQASARGDASKPPNKPPSPMFSSGLAPKSSTGWSSRQSAFSPSRSSDVTPRCQTRSCAARSTSWPAASPVD